jgi:lipoprotein-anchoring transpeptidase ErfK/SrfK
MRIARLLRQAGLAVGAAMALAGLGAGPATAQLFWDWGGGNTVGGSGREVVGFSPQFSKGQIIVSFSDRRLYYVTKPGEAISYPIAAPREQSRWQGVTAVSQKRVNPSWTPTPDMMRENPKLPRWVPGGHPMNPLGVRALYLGSSTYRIHGTDAPWTIGTNVSKGCIRMYNQDVLDLYPRVLIGTKVTVTYQRFAGYVPTGNASPVSGTRAGRSVSTPSNESGSIFSLFDNDDPPPPKPRRKVTRANSASANATANKGATSQ